MTSAVLPFNRQIITELSESGIAGLGVCLQRIAWNRATQTGRNLLQKFIGEEDFGDEGGKHAMIPNRKGQTLNEHNQLGQCKKCKKENVVVYKLLIRGFECRDCFLANARHKFRATLGSSKVLPRNANVLLIFDGSASAVVLLDMLYHAQNQAENHFKRLHCTTNILYIDESTLCESEDKSKRHVLKIFEYLRVYPAFKSFIISLASTSESLSVFENTDSYFNRVQKTEVEFIERFRSIRSLTSQQDFIKYHRNQLIANAAEQLKCGYVFKTDINTNLAMDLIVAIALGRGSSAAFDVALVDDRLIKNIKIIRPLRDLSKPEIDLYLFVQQLSPLKTDDTYGAAHGSGASLQNLTRGFIESLQENYSATVSTVFRSCDKIAPNQQLENLMSATSLKDKSSMEESKCFDKICSFCKSPVEISTSNTLLAIEFSRLISEKGVTHYRNSDLDSVARKNLSHLNDLQPLCHACRNIEKDSLIDLFQCNT